MSGLLTGATLLGQVIGGGGRRAGLGAGIGGTIGGVLGPAGAIAGSLIGGFIGGKFDSSPEFLPAVKDLNSALGRNTQAIENNNKLLELQRSFINAPSRFTAPPIQGSFGGGINGGLTIINQISGDTSNLTNEGIADATISRLEQVLSDGV